MWAAIWRLCAGWAVRLTALGVLGVSAAMVAGGWLLPPADQIAYMGNRDLQYDLFLYDARARLTVQLTHTQTANERYPAWSPDGAFIAYHANPRNHYDLYIMRADGRGQRHLELDGDLRWYDQAMIAWSPDGETLAFHAGMNGVDFALYLIAVDGGEAVELVRGEGDHVHVSWSPDGERVAFAVYPSAPLSDPQDENGTLYIAEVADLLDDAPDALTEIGRGVFPVWSPDGGAIAYVSSINENDDIFVFDLASGVHRQLTFTAPFWASTQPEWTSDGEHIVYASNRRGSFDIYMIGREGGEPRRITFTPYHAQAPAFRPG
ncbi:MAG: hypothetical protein EA396_01325 [Anaerolineaceae bacterium]|nr:MAG: hypothetical protein EA396_01325 [Anaerolineaceae bacterium]